MARLNRPPKNCRLYLFSLATVALLAASGCQSFRGYPDPVVDEKVELVRLRPYFTNDVESTYNETLHNFGEEAGKAYRNEVISQRLRAIDIRFMMFTQALNKEVNAAQLITDFAVLGLGGAGAVAGGASTKAILAAISAGLTGAKLATDKAFYAQKTLPALVAQMEASRTAQLLVLRAGMKQSTSDYPLATGLHDTDRYFTAGTLPQAITDISVAAGAKTEAASNAIRNLTVESTYTKDAATVRLENKLFPDPTHPDVADPRFREKLMKWINDPNNRVMAGTPLSAFLHFDQYAPQRAKAASELVP
jgi:hypothetical protein